MAKCKHCQIDHMAETSDPLPGMHFKLYSPTQAETWDDAIAAAAQLLADLVARKNSGDVLEKGHDGHLLYHTREVCFEGPEARHARNSAISLLATNPKQLEIELLEHGGVSRAARGGGYVIEARIHLRKDQLIQTIAYQDSPAYDPD